MVSAGFILQYDNYNFDPFRNIPYTALYLLTILEQRMADQVDLSLIDLRGVKKEAIRHYIPEKDLYLYSVSTPVANETRTIVEVIHEAYPQAKHIAGGPHISLFTEECERLYDAIVLHDGEESIVAAMEDFINNKLKPVYRQETPCHFHAYPFASRKYIAKSTVTKSGLLPGEYCHLRASEALFSRGCPYNCHFCANQKLTFTPVMFRTPQQITEEIEYLKREYNIGGLAIKDDNAIPVNRKVAIPLLEAIGETNVKWRGQSRANGIGPDIVKLAKESGCVDIAIGLESVSPQVLKIINKKIKLSEAKTYIRYLKEASIGVRLNLILGLPGEPDDIKKQTLDFIDEVQPSSVLLCLFCPVPGSEMFENPDKFGIQLKDGGWDQYRNTFGRFEEDEQPNFIYSYKEETPWGKGVSNERNYEIYMELQAVIRERKLNF
ncbi:B12-binding domain-containing radical SAM protein [Planctomycetota bacterium]